MTAGDERTTGAGAPSRRTSARGRGRVALAAGLVIVVVAVVAGWFLVGGRRAREVSEDEARRRFAATSEPSGTSTAPAAGLLARGPAPGVYRYRGQGQESTSFPPLTEEHDPRVPATVTTGDDGCWVLRLDYNTHHWQTWTYCAATGELQERGGTSFSRRVLGTADLDNTSQFTCELPAIVARVDDPPGTTRSRTCRGKGSLVSTETVVTGIVTLVGRETVTVGDDPVPTVHVRSDVTYQGGQSGTETNDQWFALADGLLVRGDHHIVSATDTVIGAVTYREDSNVVLERTTPAPPAP